MSRYKLYRKYPDKVKGFPCNLCGSTMQLRYSDLYNRPFYGCQTWPKCANTFGASETGAPLPGVDNRPKPSEAKPTNVPPSIACGCGLEKVLKWSYGGKAWFYGCVSYPLCRSSSSLEGHTLINTWSLLTEPEGVELEPDPPSKSARKRARQKARRFKAMLDDDL